MTVAEKCKYPDLIHGVIPRALGYADCRKIGSKWVHIRLCRTCGHVGRCDNSPYRHAALHCHATGHPLIEGYNPREGWGRGCVDEVLLDLGDRTAPQLAPMPRYD
jgi:Zn-finger in ubiquitin-hydrolases and other protein